MLRSRVLQFLCSELPTCSQRRCYGVGMPPQTRGEGFSTEAPSKFDIFGDKLNIEIPAAVLPSKEFVDRLKYPAQQDKLAKIISELTLIYKLSPTVPNKLSVSNWERYYGMKDVREREDYLFRLHYEELNEKKRAQELAESSEQRKKISEEQQVLHDRGEMVYARKFHQLIDIKGAQFRKQIDSVYGSRVLGLEAMDEQMPQLIVDCQFLQNLPDRQLSSFIRQIQSLHDRNWFHRQPFRITIANLLADPATSRLMKRYWMFLYGPGKRNDLSVSEAEELNLDAESFNPYDEGDDSFRPHPFIPRISSRGINDILDSGVKLEEVAYISSKANRILDGPLDRFKAFVLCASLDSKPWASSIHAAHADRIPAYRLPFDLYVKWRRGRKVMPLCNIASMLREVYNKEKDWKSAIIANVPDYHLRPDENKAPTRKDDLNPLKVKRLEREERIEIIERIMKSANMRKMDISSSFKSEDEPRLKSTIVHRYSREERNRRRQRQQQQQQQKE